MALVRVARQFPVSPDLIGPWDALLSFLKAMPPEMRPQGIEGMLRAVSGAKQQAVNLNLRQESAESRLQESLTSIAALEARVLALEEAASNPSIITHLIDEEPEGTKDSSNNMFTLSRVPLWLLLSLNGQLLFPEGEDYTLVGSVIIYVAGKVPDSTDEHRAFGLA